MDKSKAIDEETCDKRIIEKRLRSGEITMKDLKDYVDSLPDVSDNAEEFLINEKEKELEEKQEEPLEEDKEEDGD